MRLSRTPGIKKKCEVSQICKEIPFRQQLGSLADAARGASYGNEAERLLWAPSQTNEIFSDVNTTAIRLQRGEVGVDRDLSACRGRSHGPRRRRTRRLRGRALTSMHVCVPSQKLISAVRQCQCHLCLASLIPWRCTNSHLILRQRCIPAHLNPLLFNLSHLDL